MEKKDKAKITANLTKCRDEYIKRMDECNLITILWEGGDKSGIANRKMIKAVLQFCAAFLQRELDGVDKYRVAVIRDSDAARVYDEEGIEALNEYGEDNYVSSERKEFDTKAELDAYLQGLADIGAGDERAPVNYAVIMDEDLNKLEI